MTARAKSPHAKAVERIVDKTFGCGPAYDYDRAILTVAILRLVARVEREALNRAEASVDYHLSCVGPIPGQNPGEQWRTGEIAGVAACRRAAAAAFHKERHGASPSAQKGARRK